MKVTRYLASIVLLAATASVSFAQGAVSINWDTCVGPTGAASKAVAPLSIVGQYISVLGQSQAHKAYDVRILLGQPGGLKDAWRFDAVGCQGSAFLSIDHLPPAAVAKACPAFMQTSAPALQIKDFSYDALTGKARGVLANSYPNGVGPGTSTGGTVNPLTRYFLARFNYDQTYGVNGPTTPGVDCGGLEAPLCSHIIQATWLTLDGQELRWNIASEFVLANDPTNSSGCPGATPAQPKTWGSLKNQYRN